MLCRLYYVMNRGCEVALLNEIPKRSTDDSFVAKVDLIGPFRSGSKPEFLIETKAACPLLVAGCRPVMSFVDDENLEGTGRKAERIRRSR